MNKIKTLLVLGGVVVGAIPCFASEPGQLTQYHGATPNVTVQVESEARAMATGFATAFKALPYGAKYVVIKGKDGPIYWGSVRSMKAYDGVLFIQLESGVIHTVPARDIVDVTNSLPKPPPAPRPAAGEEKP